MHAVPPGPGPMLSDLEARAYAHLAPARGADRESALGTIPLPDELARELLAALDDLNDKRAAGLGRVDRRASAAAADRVRAEENDHDELSDDERAASLGRRIDFALVGGSNLELAELTNAYVRLAELADQRWRRVMQESHDETDVRDAVVDAARDVVDVIVGQGIGVDDLGARLGPFTEALNALGEAVDVYESMLGPEERRTSDGASVDLDGLDNPA